MPGADITTDERDWDMVNWRERVTPLVLAGPRAGGGPTRANRRDGEEGRATVPAILSPKAVGRWRTSIIAAMVAGVLLVVGWLAWSTWRSADLGARARSAAGRGDWKRTGALLARLAW